MLFFRIGMLLTEENEHSESSYYDVFCCSECTSLVLRDWVSKHIKWHEEHLTAQMADVAASAVVAGGYTRVPGNHPSEQDAPVLSAVESGGPDAHGHESGPKPDFLPENWENLKCPNCDTVMGGPQVFPPPEEPLVTVLTCAVCGYTEQR